MAHLSLYRKYRPQTFAEVVGQDHVTQTLANALTQDLLHHAYLFTGPRGTGKTSTARILAKAVNCVEGPTATPCNVCQQCVSITRGSSVDVIEIDAASHGGVDDVRDLRDRVAFAPASARMKVYIVDECHMLSTAGWNAFLKTVEEPPGHVLFVFATTEPHKVLATILSRTQRFDLKRVSADDLLTYVADLAGREGLTVEEGALDAVVRAGDGSVRDTLSVLDQVIAFSGERLTVSSVAEVLGTIGGDVLADLVDGLAVGDVPGLCALVGRAADDGQDLRQLARDALEHLRRVFLVKTAPDAGLVQGTPEQLVQLTGQAAKLGQVELVRAMELLGECLAQMRRGNSRLPLEIALIKAALPEACGDPAAVAARMDRLERRTGVDPSPESVGPAAATAAAPVVEPVVEPSAEAGPAIAPAQPDQPAESDPTSEPAEPSAQIPADPAVAPPAAVSSPVDLDLVRGSWPAVLDAVKRRSRRLHAFLTPGTPTAVDAHHLVVVFPTNSRFHAEQCAAEEWADAFGAVFTEVLGASLRLRSQVTDESDPTGSPEAAVPAQAQEARAVAESEAAEQAGELPDDDEAHRRAVETLTRDLGARPLDDA